MDRRELTIERRLNKVLQIRAHILWDVIFVMINLDLFVILIEQQPLLQTASIFIPPISICNKLCLPYVKYDGQINTHSTIWKTYRQQYKMSLYFSFTCYFTWRVF